MAALVGAGCASMTSTTTHKDGSTDKRSASSLLETIQGYADQGTNPDGSTYATSIQNMTGDVQMVMALDSLITHVVAATALANGNTNVTALTNLFGATPAVSKTLAVRRKLH